jgi:hypothetical protein
MRSTQAAGLAASAAKHGKMYMAAPEGGWIRNRVQWRRSWRRGDRKGSEEVHKIPQTLSVTNRVRPGPTMISRDDLPHPNGCTKADEVRNEKLENQDLLGPPKDDGQQ